MIKSLSTPENSETLSQHEYFLEPLLSSEINKFPMEVYSTGIQRTLTHIAASFQHCISNSCKHCVPLHIVRSPNIITIKNAHQ